MILKKCLFGLFLIFCLNTAYADFQAKAEPPYSEYVPARDYNRNPHAQNIPSALAMKNSSRNKTLYCF